MDAHIISQQGPDNFISPALISVHCQENEAEADHHQLGSTLPSRGMRPLWDDLAMSWSVSEAYHVDRQYNYIIAPFARLKRHHSYIVPKALRHVHELAYNRILLS